MPDCTCRGLNPDCFKCEGRGWIDDPIVKHQGKPSVRKTSPAESSSKPSGKMKKSKEEEENKTLCPHCGEKVINLGYHIKYIHLPAQKKEEERSRKEEERRKQREIELKRKQQEQERANRKEEKKRAKRKEEEERRQAEEIGIARKKALVARLKEVFESEFLFADEVLPADPDAALVSDKEYDELKTLFVREWAARELQVQLDLEQSAAVAATNRLMKNQRN